jgi:type II secretory pathway pseudopilin PulG
VNERGFSLLETTVAALAGSTVLLAVATFFSWVTGIVTQEVPAEIALQRQASVVIEELNRQIRPAASTGLSQGTCHPADPHSIGVSNVCGVFCFYKTDDGRFLEDRQPATPPNPACGPAGGTSGTLDLLQSAAVRLQANTFTSCFNNLVGGVASTLCPGAASVILTFQLEQAAPTTPGGSIKDWSNTMTFTTTIARRP